MSAHPEVGQGSGLAVGAEQVSLALDAQRPPSTPVTALLLSGAALFAISAGGLLIPGSIFAYPHSIATGEPMTVLYGFYGGWLFLLTTLLLLCFCFALALRTAARVDPHRARLAAFGVAAALAALFVGIYPSSSQDLFHNIASARVLGMYRENPLVTPPAAHPDDPLVRQVVAWRDVSSFYGPLFYAASVIPSKLAGDDVLGNLLAFKILNALALLALALLAGIAAEMLLPGRGAPAIVMVGWNPLLLYENVANGHNDVLMMALTVAGLLVAARGLMLTGLVTSVLGAAMKYPALAISPIVWLWAWKRGDRSQHVGLTALAVMAAFCFIAVILLFAAQVEVGREAAVGRPPVRSLVALLSQALQPVLGDAGLSVARITCWAAFLVVFLLGLRRLDASTASLFQVSFWVMAAITLLTVRQIYPSYLIWFVALGAILVGRSAWEIALLASISGLLSNLVFTDWNTWSATDDLKFMAAFVALPAVLIALRRWLMAPGALTWPPSPRILRLLRSTR